MPEFTDPKQATLAIQEEMAGPKARRFLALVMNKIENLTIKNLSGKVLNVRSGFLRNSVYTKEEIKGLILQGVIGVGAKYGAAWELGFSRKAYTIVPKDAKALAIPVGSLLKGVRFGKRDQAATGLTKIGRKLVIFRKKVHIPAATFAARPFIQPAIDEAQPYIKEQHQLFFNEVMKPIVITKKLGEDNAGGSQTGQ